MRYAKFAIILLVFTTLSGCVTPYQSKGLMGDYTDFRIDSNTARVSFSGNGYTSRATVENNMLYRCAEVTLQYGYDYFVIISGDTSPSYSSFTTPGTYSQYTSTNLNMYGNTGYASSSTYGTYQPGQTINIRKFESTVTIKMFKGEKPADLFNAYNAHEIINYMKPQVKPH